MRSTQWEVVTLALRQVWPLILSHTTSTRSIDVEILPDEIAKIARLWEMFTVNEARVISHETKYRQTDIEDADNINNRTGRIQARSVPVVRYKLIDR